MTEIRKRLPSSVREEEIKRLVERGVSRKKAEELVDRIFGDSAGVANPNPLEILRRSAGKLLIGGAVILFILSLIDDFRRRGRKKERREVLWV